jgi:hypothetical protein
MDYERDAKRFLHEITPAEPDDSLAGIYHDDEGDDGVAGLMARQSHPLVHGPAS